MKTIKTLTPAQVKAKITKNNKIFKKANDAQKRVILAKEIISQIKAERFLARRGNFCKIENRGAFKDLDSIQKLFLSKKIPNCTVCALGSILMAQTIFANKENIGDYESDFYDLGKTIKYKTGDTKNGIVKLFGLEQIKLIEQAFEMGQGYFKKYELDNKLPDTHKAIDFGNQYFSSDVRLINIMENIISNKGTFVP